MLWYFKGIFWKPRFKSVWPDSVIIVSYPFQKRSHCLNDSNLFITAIFTSCVGPWKICRFFCSSSHKKESRCVNGWKMRDLQVMRTANEFKKIWPSTEIKHFYGTFNTQKLAPGYKTLFLKIAAKHHKVYPSRQTLLRCIKACVNLL